MTVLEDYRKFVREYPRHRYQPGALEAFEVAVREVSASDLQFAVRLFAREVVAARPGGRKWRFCPGPRTWLTEGRYRKYLDGEKQ